MKLFRRLKGQDKIIDLTNQLIEELRHQGFDFMYDDTDPGFGAMNIWIHNGKEVEVQNILKKWAVKGNLKAVV